MYKFLLNETPNHIKHLIRQYEKTRIKMLKNKWSQVYNVTCLEEKLVPTYTKTQKCSKNFFCMRFGLTQTCKFPTQMFHIIFKESTIYYYIINKCLNKVREVLKTFLYQSIISSGCVY